MACGSGSPQRLWARTGFPWSCRQELMLSLGSPVTWRDPGVGELAKPEPPGAETTLGTHSWDCLRVSPSPPKGHPELVPFLGPFRPAAAQRWQLPRYTPLPNAPRCWHWRRGWNWWSRWPRGLHR